MNITSKTRRPQLLAYIAALEASVADHQRNVEGLSARIEELEAECVALDTQRAVANDIALVESRGALLRKLKALTIEGVPCRMRGAAITHVKTGAVLAQVRA